MLSEFENYSPLRCVNVYCRSDCRSDDSCIHCNYCASVVQPNLIFIIICPSVAVPLQVPYHCRVVVKSTVIFDIRNVLPSELNESATCGKYCFLTERNINFESLLCMTFIWFPAYILELTVRKHSVSILAENLSDVAKFLARSVHATIRISVMLTFDS